MSEIILMENVNKVFGAKTALKSVSCKVEKKKIFGLLGPSGAGKTTMIRILIGATDLTGGSARIFDQPCDKLGAEIYKKIGMVLDEPGLYTRLTGYDNLQVLAKIHDVDKKEIWKVLEQVDLAADAKKQVSKYSKGMLQRLVFARAILNKPELLFLDEPTSGLDPTTAQKIHKLILELASNGTTVFLTTHNMQEATKLCDNVALLNDGNIVEYGAPKDLCNKYNTDQKFHVTLKDGQQFVFDNKPQSAKAISNYITDDKIRSMHTSEPNLEDVFIKLTGRELL